MVDFTLQSGFYDGVYDEESAAYSGTYTVDGGKQFIVVPDCVEYYIASHGTWWLFSPGTTLSGANPDAGGADIDGDEITWNPPAGTVFSLVSIVDVDNALAGADPAIPWQTLAFGDADSVMVPSGLLVRGREYVLGVASADEGDMSLTYYSSRSFVAQ